ncbi:tyrosine-type recombinase/integrase [Laspinema olomoucense]|uniref:tyrosine-type recombinase/integrase n=1 Tax=Laspinema olomoucense TaxID=3231600 RepID=UPI0021BB61B3|nr:site-specific integrase [Laspinema sp. D3a]MCT7988978.1 tyrosine-type recombinase/integrase [Laspinema sp. D3a]
MFKTERRWLICDFRKVLFLVVTLARLATEFLERSDLAKSTQRSYEAVLMPLLALYGRLPVEIISRQVICDYLQSLEHLSINTHHRHQAIIQSLFNYGVAFGYLKSNPIAGLTRRKPLKEKGEHGTDEVIRYLNHLQLVELYKVVQPDVRLHAIVGLLHRTGARVGEVLALDLEQVDTLARKFQVVGKGNKQRWCFYSEDAAKVLDQYVRYYRDAGEGALFTAQNPFTKEVTRLSYRRVHATWRDLTAQSPVLRGARLHDLRHTFATERVGLMSIEELRALMGHEKIQTTLRYQKVTSQRAEEVAQKALKALTSLESEISN